MASIVRDFFNVIVRRGSRGSLSSWIPGQPAWYGQPLSNRSYDYSGLLITPERMREIVMKTPTAASCLNAILDYAVNVPIQIRNIDASEPADPDRVEFVRQFLARPNNFDTWNHYLAKTVRDAVVLGWAGTEIEWNTENRPHAIHALDAAKLKMDFDEHGNLEGFTMLNQHGMPIVQADGSHAWKPRDVIYFRRDAVSDSLYPVSRIQQLFVLATIELLMLHFIGSRFTDSNVPYGIYDLGDISEQELKRAAEMWNEQSQSPHQIMLTGSKSGGKFTPFAYNLKDLEAHAILADVQSKMMGICGVTKNEFGDSEDVNKSNGYNLSFTFKKRALEPILNEIATSLTSRLLWDSFGFNELEVAFREIDSRDELLQAQIDQIYLERGILTVNQIRNRRGDPSAEGGDDLLLMTGSNWIPLRLIGEYAEAQLMGIEAMVQATLVDAANPGDGTGKPPISPPIIRAPQSPERFTTPGGTGSSTAKFNYPRPQQTKEPSRTTPQRGQHQLRGIGLRQDGK